MADEKDIMVLLQHIIWNLCSLTDELKFACTENIFCNHLMTGADGGYMRPSIGLINDFHISLEHIWNKFEGRIMLKENIFDSSFRIYVYLSYANNSDVQLLSRGLVMKMFLKDYNFSSFNHFIWVDYLAASGPGRPLRHLIKSWCECSGDMGQLVTNKQGHRYLGSCTLYTV